MNFNTLAKKLFIWRAKKISDKNFMLIMAIVVGIAVGLAAVIMKNSVHFVRQVAIFIINRYSFSYIYIFFPAIGIALTILFVNLFIKKKLGHGIPMVLYYMSKKGGKIEKHNMFSRIIASSLTVGFGGSVGLEGPIVATGSAIGSNIGQFFRLNYRHLILLIGCGSTGAIAAIFKAPIAAIVFTLEVIMLDLTMGSLMPLLLSSISAALTSYLFLGQNYVYHLAKIDPFILKDVPLYILLGIVAGLLSTYFSKLYLWQAKKYDKLKRKRSKFIVGAIILGVLVFLFPSLYGEGYEAVNQALHGDISYIFEGTFYSEWQSFIGITLIVTLILFTKIFATGATFGAGGTGGIFAPSLFIGANLGFLFAHIANSIKLKISYENFALVGMAGLIAGIIHAPLTAIFLIAEITGGYKLFIPLMIVATISYFVAKLFMHKSVYTILLAERGQLLTHNADSNMLTLMKTESLIETNFLTINEDAKLQDLTKVISRSSRAVYVVVDSENYFKGLIWLDHVKHLMFKTELYESVNVRDLMDIPKHTVNTNMKVKEIAELFENSNYFNLPVVDEGKYIGFVSRAKVFTTYRQMLKKFSHEE
ncbi:MAG: chloride channel protein [Bacteroidales bacterium]|jgi:CIC family chloride channel protein|nr:chloride channel protein [Bacteroidales bacterium]MCK9498611.1 chloride channel protein [Bacteroidales bacterium]MDY0313643.1 chloride channel protein [Bacteroidales bacterium]NLB86231.1 chloride channel protein [Bacteroidales bacterium]